MALAVMEELAARWLAMAALGVPVLAQAQAGLAVSRTKVQEVRAAWAAAMVARVAQEALHWDRVRPAAAVGKVALEVLVLLAAAAAMAATAWEMVPAARVA
jgi:hypothetical protein